MQICFCSSGQNPDIDRHRFIKMSLLTNLDHFVRSPQSVLKPRPEARSLGGGAGQEGGELLQPEQRAELRLRKEPWLRGNVRLHQEPRRWAGFRGEWKGERGWTERGGRSAETGVDPLHTCWELLLQRPDGPSGTVLTADALSSVQCSVAACRNSIPAHTTNAAVFACLY